MMKRYCSISKLIISLLILICYLFIIPSTHAEIIERVVGIINDDVILMSEFDAAYNTARSTGTSMSEAEFLDDMINRKLILEQARRFRFEGAERRKVSDNMLIEKYLERRIRPLFTYLLIL